MKLGFMESDLRGYSHLSNKARRIGFETEAVKLILYYQLGFVIQNNWKCQLCLRIGCALCRPPESLVSIMDKENRLRNYRVSF